MTPAEDVRTRAAEELIERTVVARGLPRHIIEPAVMARVAVLLRPEGSGQQPARRRPAASDVDVGRMSPADPAEASALVAAAKAASAREAV
jgi:hypothetical protein